MDAVVVGPISGELAADDRCERGCGDSFAWARTHKGKRIPIDLTPNPSGNIALYRESDAGLPRATIMAKGDVPKGDRYLSHFATCPDAARFRR